MMVEPDNRSLYRDGLEELDKIPASAASKIHSRQNQKRMEVLLHTFLLSGYDCIYAPSNVVPLPALKEAYKHFERSKEIKIDAYRGYCQIYKVDAFPKLIDADLDSSGKIVPVDYDMGILEELGWSVSDACPEPQLWESRSAMLDNIIARREPVEIVEPDEQKRRRLYSAVFSYQKRNPEKSIKVSMDGDLIIITFTEPGGQHEEEDNSQERW